MHKSLALLATLAASALADTPMLVIYNTASTKDLIVDVPYGQRYCICLKNTQTGYIDGTKSGNVKLFWSSDCTGNYDDGSHKGTDHAQWVNSVSFGAAGVPSTWGAGKTCNWY
ncbi:hypothetical protein BGZ83_007560 [Gryganskiella cystojenkinii]|nr:hypothetical protein BGZ83_007560 [Gryganskiella cystojenkinii]